MHTHADHAVYRATCKRSGIVVALKVRAIPVMWSCCTVHVRAHDSTMHEIYQSHLAVLWLHTAGRLTGDCGICRRCSILAPAAPPIQVFFRSRVSANALHVAKREVALHLPLVHPNIM